MIVYSNLTSLKAGEKVWKSEGFRTVEYVLIEDPVVMYAPGVGVTTLKVSHRGGTVSFNFSALQATQLFREGNIHSPLPILLDSGENLTSWMNP